jgi:hypothetical protein
MKDKKLKVLFREEIYDYDDLNEPYDDMGDILDPVDVFDSKKRPIDPAKYYNNPDDPQYNYTDMNKSLFECHVPETVGEVQLYNYRVRKDPNLTEDDLLIGIRKDGSVVEEKGDDYYSL